MSDSKWWQFGARREAEAAERQSPSQTQGAPAAEVTPSTAPAMADASTSIGVDAASTIGGDQETYVTLNLTHAEAETIRTAVQDHQVRQDAAADPARYGREYEDEEAHNLVTAAQEQSSLASTINAKVDQGISDHVPSAPEPAVDPETGRAVGIGPNGEIGAGYVDEHPEPNDTHAVVPLALTEAEAGTVRDALDRYERAAQSALESNSDRDYDDAPDVDALRSAEGRSERAGHIDDKLKRATLERATNASGASPTSEPEVSTRRSSSFPRSANETLTAERAAAPAAGTAAGAETSARSAAGAEAPFRAGQQHVNGHGSER